MPRKCVSQISLWFQLRRVQHRQQRLQLRPLLHIRQRRRRLVQQRRRQKGKTLSSNGQKMSSPGWVNSASWSSIRLRYRVCYRVLYLTYHLKFHSNNESLVMPQNSVGNSVANTVLQSNWAPGYSWSQGEFTQPRAHSFAHIRVSWSDRILNLE